jgi:Phosphotransferase enzyme family.
MDVRRIADQVFSDRRVTAIDQMNRGNRKQTSVVEFADKPSVIAQLSTDIGAIRSELAVTLAISETDWIPVPRVLDGGVVGETGYMLTESVSGEDLHERFSAFTAADRQRVAHSFGRVLGEIHAATEFETCGPVRPTGRQWERDQWPVDVSLSALAVEGGADPVDWLVTYGAEALDRLPPAFDPEARQIRTRLEALSPADWESKLPQETALFPWDLRPGNALVDGAQITAILDWEAPMAAPVALAVAKVEYLVTDWYLEDPEPERAAFRDGYRSVRPYPEIPPLQRALAITASTVDSNGVVTNPMYPELGRAEAVAFHRQALQDCL